MTGTRKKGGVPTEFQWRERARGWYAPAEVNIATNELGNHYQTQRMGRTYAPKPGGYDPRGGFSDIDPLIEVASYKIDSSKLTTGQGPLRHQVALRKRQPKLPDELPFICQFFQVHQRDLKMLWLVLTRVLGQVRIETLSSELFEALSDSKVLC